MKKLMRKVHQSEKGQALFEFLAFFPFMMILYSITLTISSAINGSINQQKITRGYFYNLIHNDSAVPTLEILQDFRNHGIESVGMFAIGWTLKSVSEQQVAPCYKIMSFSKNTSTEVCDPGNKAEESTQFIRVKTVYGICTATYRLDSGGYFPVSNISLGLPAASYSSCINTSN